MVSVHLQEFAILKIQRYVVIRMMLKLTLFGQDIAVLLHHHQQVLQMVCIEKNISLNFLFIWIYSDHTYESSVGHYMYIETSSPQKPGDIARLISPEYDVSPGGSCLQFFYHMWGSDTGAFNVYLKASTDISFQGAPLWALIGDQDDLWRTARATIRTTNKFQVNDKMINS